MRDIKKWELWEEELLKENYLYGDQKEMEAIFKVKWHSIKYKAQLLGLHRDLGKLLQGYSFNEDYFEVVDTEDKAYFLGLLYADGNITISKYKNVMCIHLIEPDKDVLDKFNVFLEYKRPLKINKVKDTIQILNGKEIKCNFDSYELNVHSAKFCNDLIKLGCIPAKTLKLKFPTEEQVPKELIRHFIRGVFDGDGTISNGMRGDGYNYVNMSILGTVELLEGINKNLAENCDLTENKLYRRANYKISSMNYSGFKSLIKIKDYLYKDATIFLERKFNKFPKTLTKINNKYEI